MHRFFCLSVAAVIACAGGAAPAVAQPAAGVEASATPKTRLYVKTIPAGAQVMLDGEPLGPSDGLFLVPAGTAEVSVVFDGQAPQVRQVEIAEGQITRVEIRLGADRAVANAGSGAPAAAGDMVAVFSTGVILKSSRKLESPPVPITKFDASLDKPLEVELHETPLAEAARLIGQKAGLRVSLDDRALAEAGLGPALPLTVSVAGQSLASGLDIVCRHAGLGWTVAEDGLRITTAEKAAERRFVHVHEVSDLCEEHLQALIDVLRVSIAPETWDSVGGPGSIRPDRSDAGTFLVVSQTLAVQRQVRSLLECLRRLKALPPDERAPLAGDGYWSVAAAKARTALTTPCGDVEFAETPLVDALQGISAKAGVSITLDSRVLAEAGLDAGTPVTLAATTLPLAELLERVLAPLGLAFALVDDQLTVTTADQAGQIVTAAVYPVHRLIGSEKKGRSFQSLIDLVCGTVAPETWDVVGGPGGIQPIDGDVPCLIIRQTTAGHRAVDAFLQSLR